MTREEIIKELKRLRRVSVEDLECVPDSSMLIEYYTGMRKAYETALYLLEQEDES
jgi:hypothetical protein